MLEPFRFSTNLQKVHLVGDTHFCHDPNWVGQDPIWKQRGYSSCFECDEGQIEIWNKRVDINDIVIHVGDFIFKDPDGKIARNYINRLNGKIYLLWGNHNSGVKQIYKEEVQKYCTMLTAGLEDIEPEIYPLTYNNKITFVGNYMYGRIDHHLFVASHFPFKVWDNMQKGAINICGHSHGSCEHSNPNNTECKCIDVGIENFGGPIEFYQLMDIMSKKKITQYGSSWK